MKKNCSSHSRLVLCALAALACTLGTGALKAQSTINFMTTGAITSDDPVETGRLSRNGTPSVYTTNKAYPGTYDQNSYGFDEYVFTNKNPFAEAVFITLTTTNTLASGNIPFSEAYLTFFDPTNIGTNYRGDAGNSPAAGSTFQTTSYSILVPANTGFDVIVNEIAAGGPVTNYTLTVSTVPEPSTWGMLGLGAVGAGVVALRRHRTRA